MNQDSRASPPNLNTTCINLSPLVKRSCSTRSLLVAAALPPQAKQTLSDHSSLCPELEIPFITRRTPKSSKVAPRRPQLSRQVSRSRLCCLAAPSGLGGLHCLLLWSRGRRRLRSISRKVDKSVSDNDSTDAEPPPLWG